MSANNPSQLSPYYLAFSNFRELLVRVPVTEQDADPEVFEQLSRAAINIAELLRDWRRKRAERVAALSAKMSAIFPEFVEKAAAGFARIADEALDRVETAVQSATETSGRLAELDFRARAALDNRDYGSVAEHASRAGEHQAAILEQREYLASLLASLSRDGGDRVDADFFLGVPDRRRDLAHTEANSSVLEQTEAAPEPELAPAQRSEPDLSSARGFDGEAVGEPADTAPRSDRVALAALPEMGAWEPEPVGTRLAVSPKTLEPSEIVPSSPSVEAVNGAFWSALAQGRLGLAQGLLEVGAPNGNLLGPAIELAAMAMVADGTGEIVDAARETAGRVLTAWRSEDAAAPVSPETAFAAAVMLLPASILLALLAPGSNQAGLLGALPLYSAAPLGWQPARRLPSLCAMARETAEAITVLGQEFLPDQKPFVSLISHEEWTAALHRRCESVQSWVAAQLAKTICNSAATDVWHALICPGTALGQLLTIAIEDRAPQLDWVRLEDSHPRSRDGCERHGGRLQETNRRASLGRIGGPCRRSAAAHPLLGETAHTGTDRGSSRPRPAGCRIAHGTRCGPRRRRSRAPGARRRPAIGRRCREQDPQPPRCPPKRPGAETRGRERRRALWSRPRRPSRDRIRSQLAPPASAAEQYDARAARIVRCGSRSARCRLCAHFALRFCWRGTGVGSETARPRRDCRQ